jgi:hypothetical protein
LTITLNFGVQHSKGVRKGGREGYQKYWIRLGKNQGVVVHSGWHSWTVHKKVSEFFLRNQETEKIKRQ